MFKADCTESQRLFSTGSLQTSLCLIRRAGTEGEPEACDSRLWNALHKTEMLNAATTVSRRS